MQLSTLHYTILGLILEFCTLLSSKSTFLPIPVVVAFLPHVLGDWHYIPHPYYLGVHILPFLLVLYHTHRRITTNRNMILDFYHCKQLVSRTLIKLWSSPICFRRFLLIICQDMIISIIGIPNLWWFDGTLESAAYPLHEFRTGISFSIPICVKLLTEIQ